MLFKCLFIWKRKRHFVFVQKVELTINVSVSCLKDVGQVIFFKEKCEQSEVSLNNNSNKYDSCTVSEAM